MIGSINYLMLMPSPLVANSAWWLTCLAESRRFHRATHHVQTTQARYLTDLLARNANTAWGRQFNFSTIRSVKAFQNDLPLTTYEDYRAAIEAIGNGEPTVLTADPVMLLEPTSGSASAAKLIPYTKSLQAEFQRGIAAWIADLFAAHPSLLNGSAYWSVSPVAQRAARTAGGIPIGFEDDSAYLGQQGALVQAVMAVPSAVKLIEDIAAFRYVTLLFLLARRDLVLFSVWNPTFLTLLLDQLPRWYDLLVEDIRAGTLTPPVPLASDVHHTLLKTIRPRPQRASELERPGASHAAALFPNLQLLSCWADANAAPYATQLATRFPQVALQGKGVLATEGFVSFPLVGKAGTALSVRSHFYEFLPDGDENERPRLAHELQQGAIYEVVITTGGGLYRYRMHDLVAVVGFYHQCPLLKFVGKTALMSDWFGEKLNERHVCAVITQTLHKYNVSPAFAMLACDEQQTLPCYVLYLQSGAGEETNGFSRPVWRQIGIDIETGLLDNFHYRYCRHLGQLGAVKTFEITTGALAVYQARCVALGQRAGDIKPLLLHRVGGWTAFFEGGFTQE